MNRQQFEHLLRAASTIVDEQDVVVFGSQAILGTFSEDKLPPEATFPSKLISPSSTIRMTTSQMQCISDGGYPDFGLLPTKHHFRGLNSVSITAEVITPKQSRVE